MKNLKNTILITLITVFFVNLYAQDRPLSKVDYNGFMLLSDSLRSYRSSRLIDIETFNEYANNNETLILDTRSKVAYDNIHVKGAIHLNFSDFTVQKLAEVIPNKNTRILIYCNNNFESKFMVLADKSPSLALNIPTFINLYGYGYKNIYELSDYLNEEDDRVEFEIKN